MVWFLLLFWFFNTFLFPGVTPEPASLWYLHFLMILNKSWEACHLSDAKLQLCLETGAVPGQISLPYTMHPAIGGTLDLLAMCLWICMCAWQLFISRRPMASTAETSRMPFHRRTSRAGCHLPGFQPQRPSILIAYWCSLGKWLEAATAEKDFGVQIWEDDLHLKNHLQRFRTGLRHTQFVWLICQDLSS